jgi:hypothetical protein
MIKLLKILKRRKTLRKVNNANIFTENNWKFFLKKAHTETSNGFIWKDKYYIYEGYVLRGDVVFSGKKKLCRLKD